MAPFRLSRLLLALGSAALILGACGDPLSDEAFGSRVRAYLLENPEVLVEVSQKLEAKQASGARELLENDSRDFVANPKGSITLVEFYDYRCSYCVRAAGDVQALIEANPDVRLVYKELPIFGDVSELAAKGALAAHAQGKDATTIHRQFMATQPLTEQAVRTILGRNGVRLDQANLADIEQHLSDTRALASRLGINGTPTFVIGDTTIPGADMAAVKAAVEAARARGRS